MIFFFYPLYDFDVLVENGTKETGYAVANSKIDARKMVLEYFFLITPVTLHTKYLKAGFFFFCCFFFHRIVVFFTMRLLERGQHKLN